MIVEPQDFVALAGLLHEHFDFTTTAETAVAIDPCTLAPAMADALRCAGAGRASLGVQLFDPVVHKAARRWKSLSHIGSMAISIARWTTRSVQVSLIHSVDARSFRAT